MERVEVGDGGRRTVIVGGEADFELDRLRFVRMNFYRKAVGSYKHFPAAGFFDEEDTLRRQQFPNEAVFFRRFVARKRDYFIPKAPALSVFGEKSVVGMPRPE